MFSKCTYNKQTNTNAQNKHKNENEYVHEMNVGYHIG